MIARPTRIAGLLIAGLTLSLVYALSAEAGPAQAYCKHRNSAPETISRAEARRATICLINKRRLNFGLPRVRSKEGLKTSADRHDRYMIKHACFSHQCEGEPDLISRIANTGYLSGASRYGCGEVIAANDGHAASPRRIVRGWMASDSHRAALLSRSYRHIGGGVVWGMPSDPDAHAGTYTIDLCFRGG